MKTKTGPSLFKLIASVAIVFCPIFDVRAQEPEPISTTGHGGFFDQNGKQIPVTAEFVTRAQAWYRSRLITELNTGRRRDFDSFEKKLIAGIDVSGQDRLVLQHHALEWLIVNVPPNLFNQRAGAKLRALRWEMNWRLREQPDLRILDKRETFTPGAEVRKRLESPDFKIVPPRAANTGGGANRVATSNFGLAYMTECLAAGVPVPPSINVMDPSGTAGWRSQGFIPTLEQFIGGTPAELRTYKSSSPEGMCMALPRYSDATLATVALDGVICLGRQSSKVCFWDNQMAVTPSTGIGTTFSFPATQRIPIGAPDLVVNPAGRYQAGGKEIEFNAAAGICTDCHAGENPYIIHPDTNLGTATWGSLSGSPQNLPTKSVNRYIPLAAPSWPQNLYSHAAAYVPGACSGCHRKAGAGRFPHLSNEIPGYCTFVLANAITRTMPQGSPGTAPAAGANLTAQCNAPPVAAAEDRGDPHISTTNGVRYDFQAAGEFTALRHDDTTFELQTRQSPVLTTFIPGANPHTGLASCVSLNTAVALQLGKSRVSYQLGSGNRWYLRVDGQVRELPRRLELGDGNTILRGSASGEIEVRASNGTRVMVTPMFWSSQGYWYLDVQVLNTPARSGIMGAILSGEWLPRGSDGSNFGSRPIPLMDRHLSLNQKFADSWRVNTGTSLFDYTPGTSTADFTDQNWPAPPGGSCTATSIKGKVPSVREPRPDIAERACRNIKNKDILADCILDVTVMGDAKAATVHIRADQARQN